MDGVHDLGGREGFGPIVDKADERPFHADWEMRAFGIKEVSAAGQSTGSAIAASSSFRSTI
jgi:nitrile hydratase subunit beta